MKRIFAFLLVLALALTGCQWNRDPKAAVFRLVETNYDKILTACQSGDTAALSAIKGVTSVHVEDGYVVVFCRGAGIAPSTRDYGFYYTADNIPATVDCNQRIMQVADQLQREGSGWQCVIQENVFYTEQIRGNLYFYSNVY